MPPAPRVGVGDTFSVEGLGSPDGGRIYFRPYRVKSLSSRRGFSAEMFCALVTPEGVPPWCPALRPGVPVKLAGAVDMVVVQVEVDSGVRFSQDTTKFPHLIVPSSEEPFVAVTVMLRDPLSLATEMEQERRQLWLIARHFEEHEDT